MFNPTLIAKGTLLKICLLLTIFAGFAATSSVTAQQSDYEIQRERASELFDQQNFAAAIPILEKLVKLKSDDSSLWEKLGWSTMVVASTIKDPSQRKQARARALQAFQRAKALGDDSNLLRTGLEAMSGPDPAELTFSMNPAADTAMREGEEAHARGDLDTALARYKRALELDPKLYHAALFAGDMEFKKGYNSTDPQFRNGAFDRAGIWFAKAIAIDPDFETAYRYWGDALDAQGKTDAARDKFIEAIVADPYNQSPYMGLMQWGHRHGVKLGHPKVEVPSNVTSNKPGEMTINIDELALKGSADDGSAAWMMYGIARANWMNKKDGSLSDRFKKAYPQETVYRHSLAEEVEALRLVAESIQTQIKDKRVKKLTISLENLMRLHETGLLEAYVLFARPDQGVARDYAAYRAANREKLRRYWLDVAIIR